MKARVLNWIFVGAVVCIMAGVRLMGTNAQNTAQSADTKAQSAQKLADQIRESVLKECKAERQNREFAAKDRATLVKVVNTLLNQPAELVDPQARAQRTTLLRDIVAPIASPLPTLPPCTLPPRSS